MVLPQDGCPAYIRLPLFQHDLGKLVGKPGAHRPLPVLLNRGVGPLVSMEYGEFAAHLPAEGVQKRRLVLRPLVICQFIGQHIRSAYAHILHHGHGKPVEHPYTEHHHHGYAHPQHQRHQVPHLAPDPFAFSYRFRMIPVHLHAPRLSMISSPAPLPLSASGSTGSPCIFPRIAPGFLPSLA